MRHLRIDSCGFNAAIQLLCECVNVDSAQPYKLRVYIINKTDGLTYLIELIENTQFLSFVSQSTYQQFRDFISCLETNGINGPNK